MIEVVLDRLAAQGVTRAVLSLGYKPEVFRDRWPDGRISGIAVDYAIDPFPLDTAGAIRYAARQAGIDETFVALNGDVVTSADLSAQLARHRETGATGTVHLVPVDDPSRFGVVSLAPDDKVLGFVEKPAAGEAPSNLINAGTYVFEPDVLDLIPDNEPVSVERVTFPLLVEQGRLFGHLDADDVYWVDAGTPEALRRVSLDLVDGVWGDAEPAVAGTAHVADSAELQRVLIGDGAVITSGVCISDSVVMAGAVIGEGAVITASIVGPSAHIGAAATVHDRVIGPGETVS